MDALLSTRSLIAKTLQQSDSVSSAMEASSRNLRKASSSLADSSDCLRFLHQRLSTLSALSLHADHAAGPASAHSSVVLLQRSLSASDPSADLPGYLASVRRLEQALSFLTENCALAIHWLNDVASLLDESSAADEGYALNVKRSLAVLEELKAMEARDRLPGGVLCLALDKLELQLRRILHDIPLDSDENDSLVVVVDRLRLNGRGGRVAPVYVDVRISVARRRIMSIWGSDDDDDVGQWMKEVEFVVREVVQVEHDICRTMCDCSSGVISMDCYAEIVLGSGFLELLAGFGNKVVAAKKDATKLLKLLDAFGALDELRPDFNRLFGGKECARVQGVTRDLVRRVVEGAVDIFDQLVLELERTKADVVVDGGAGVPRLVVFVTDYCQVLLEDDKYKRALLQVLSIHRLWHGGHHDAPSPNRVLEEGVCRIMGALEVKLEKWANRLDDPALACVFLVDNYRYLHCHLEDTELGRLLEEEYRVKMDFYAAAHSDLCNYRKIPSSIVNEDELTLGRRKMKAYT